MSNLNNLSVAERNVLIVASRNRKDFEQVAHILDLKSAQVAKEIFESARRKLIHQAYGDPDQGWRTTSAIAKILGVDHYWVARYGKQFANLAIQRDAGNGMVVPHYPPQVLEALRTIRHEAYGEPDEGWVTITTMRNQLGADWNWLNRRLGPYRHLAVLRKSNGGHSRSHYPSGVLNAMRTLREAQKACPEAGDYLNTTQLLEQLGKSWAWIAKTLTSLGFVAEQRRNRRQKLVKHYPPEVLPLLREIASEFPASGDWLTVNRLANLLKADREWVEGRIQEHGFIGEIRCQPGYGKPAMHYPPETLATLQPMAHQYPLADGWLTANALEVLTGTSTNWVVRRLREMRPEAQMRKSEQGVPRLHYPPEVLEKLLRRKAALGKLQGRQTAGLRFRLRILNILAETTEPATLSRIKSKLQGVHDERQIYDGLLWLKQRNLVTRVRTKKTRWQITDDGRDVLAIETPVEVSA